MSSSPTTARPQADAKSVITCDLEGRIQTYNAGAATLFGWAPDEVIGKKRVSLFSPGPVVLEHVPRWLAKSVANGSHETDTVFLRKDGARFPAHIRITPTFKGDVQTGFCGVTTTLPESELARAEPRIALATRVFGALVITRAPFLTATLVPVLVAGALASHAAAAGDASGLFSRAYFALALVGALALHVAANTWNDLFDWRSGADQANNDYFLPFSGGSRAIELGLIGERGLARVAWTSLALATACGAALAWWSTPLVLAVGAVGALLAYFYTAPPVRLAARRGLGELAVAAAFGPLLTVGVTLAATGTATAGAALVGVPVGLLTAAILLINEIPDSASDATVGKNHLVVTLGAGAARAVYVALLAGAVAAHGALVVVGVVPALSLLALLALPLAARALSGLFRHVSGATVDRRLIAANKATIQLQLAYGLLFALGVWLG